MAYTSDVAFFQHARTDNPQAAAGLEDMAGRRGSAVWELGGQAGVSAVFDPTWRARCTCAGDAGVGVPARVLALLRPLYGDVSVRGIWWGSGGIWWICLRGWRDVDVVVD